MTPYIHAIRALTALMFRKLLVPVFLFIGSVSVFIVIGIAVLAIKFSTLWLIAYIIIVPILIILLGLGTFGWVISGRLFPRKLDKKEYELLAAFADKLLRIAEARSTPPPIIGIIVAKDIITRNKKGYIEQLVIDTSSLKADFTRITQIFS